MIDRWTELALAARDGNVHAMDQFVRETHDSVQRLCRLLGDPDTVDDLVQDTYLRALRSLPRFRRDGSARSWLLAIARNTCADATRSRVRARQHLRALDPDAEHASSLDGPWAEVDDLLRPLDPDRREAFVLTQLLGLPYAEAAEIAGCPVGTIRSRVSRARADLLGALDDDRPGKTAAPGASSHQA
jgi:RNA polymerase sigma-70 factor (ECF subfamily)